MRPVARSFGQRGAPIPRPAGRVPAPPPAPPPIALPAIPQEAPPTFSLDREIREWKRASGHRYEVPWRPLALMATLCFGVASFVLPASVNASVQWLLWGLTAASFYTGFRRRRRR
jgi:hypothetical protein